LTCAKMMSTANFLCSRILLPPLSLYLRWCPWEAGRWRLLKRVLPWSRSLVMDRGPKTLMTRHGFRLRIELNDWLGRNLYISGEHETSTSLVIESLLGPGETFVDVGANVGFFSVLAGRSVGPAGKVYAFEPVDDVRDRLIENILLNELSNVIVRPEALSDREDSVEIYVGPRNHRGLSSLRPLKNDSGGVQEVKTTPLDRFLPEGERVAMVKVDVEGAEFLAVTGMRDCLARDKPDLIIEVTDSYLRRFGHTAEMLCSLLAELGYRMYAIDHAGLVPIVDARAQGLPEQFNALFTTRSCLPAPLVVREQWQG
jgi:FkbM family methyltransferase